jgi:hypothetical protein
MFVLCMNPNQVILLHAILQDSIMDWTEEKQGPARHEDFLQLLRGVHSFYDLKNWGCERNYEADTDS